MFKALVFSAVAAGCAGGLITSTFQWAAVTPLILEAEVFEQGVTTASHGVAATDWARTALTSLATMVYASGLALVLLGLMQLAGIRIDGRAALGWGIAGFFAVALAPALGLPPVVPGIPEAPLLDRQVWWLGTVMATAFGLWAILQRRTPAWAAVGIAVLLLPHLIGAPHPEAADTDVPAMLAAHFVAASLAASALLWASVSWLAGQFHARLAPVDE
jgi:cobalt transporter subunit CbtA